VREGDKVTSLPAIQAVMRSQFALAVKGNGPAQRAMIAAIHAMEQELLAEAAAEGKAEAELRPMTNLEAGRRIASMLWEAYKEKGEPRPGTLMEQIVGLIAQDKGKTGG
jgi:hypothetical protein